MDLETAKDTLNTVNSLYGFPVREPDLRRSSNRRVYDIKKLWSRNKEILQLDSLGYKHTEIAKMLGVTPTCVQMTLNSTLGKEAQLAIREERDEEYQAQRQAVMELTWKALDVYDEILEDETESRKLKKDVADTVTLELAGMRAPTKIQSMSTSTVLTAEELAEFKKRGYEAAKAAGKLIDIEENK